ncbi:MAG: hypothetical protein A2Y17_03640 [Clostridiales bacterium GWF2_38_85]|nr:MAG: hypothetical protein A2Y17_03640 [Clostridiales bacterium GWF2_38_85]HBL85301.1 patatin [Clostridiales bacterium]
MIGVALEGGGARGSYQVGAVKAFYEHGYKFNGFVGTSIGSINCALLAQNDLDTLIKMWNTVDTSTLFDVDDETVKYIVNMQFDKLNMAKIYTTFAKVIKDKGADTSKIRKLLFNLIDEKKLRHSDIDFGLVTVSLPDFRPLEVMLEDIPDGKVIDYIMASSCFPGFMSAQISTKHYIDGGFFDNMPVNMLAKRGYDEIIAIRTISPGVIRKLEYKDVKITTITPSDNLGLLMFFSPEQAKINLQLGYYDALRFIKKLGGTKYFVQKIPDDIAFSALTSIDYKVINGIAKLLNLSGTEGMRLLFEGILPSLSQKLKIPKKAGYGDIIISIFEYAALKWQLPRFKEYSYKDFCMNIKNTIHQNPLSKADQTPLMMAILRFISALPDEKRNQ